MLKKSNTWHIIGIVVGIALIAAGAMVYFKSISASVFFEHPDKMTFGADFYTYQYEATRIAAKNSYYSVLYLSHIADIIQSSLSLGFVGWGLLTIRHHAQAISENKPTVVE